MDASCGGPSLPGQGAEAGIEWGLAHLFGRVMEATEGWELPEKTRPLHKHYMEKRGALERGEGPEWYS
jgi:hypothetical protein